jgi:parallel beta-helix repeat protein
MTHHTLFPVFQWKRRAISVHFARLWHILILLFFLAALVGIPTSSVQAATPVVSDIPDQTIDEGGAFATVILDNYVADAGHTADQMTWTTSGDIELTVTINPNRVATISTPDPDWNGNETITFRATDPVGFYSEDAATFTVTAVNDAPVVSDIPDQTIAEGGTFTTINLDNYVSDVDNADAEMTWTYNGNSQLTVDITNRVATISTPGADWNGTETVTFRATDPGLLFDEDSATFTVTPVNDAPVITGQVPLSTPINTSLTITLSDLLVTDVDNPYPTGFSLTVMAGANYTFVGSTITPATDYVGTLTVPVLVNDGAADSNTYDLSVTVNLPRTYYVDKTNPACVDGDLGTLATPLCTIGRGEFLALAGDTVQVLNGTYTETVFVEHSGIAGYPITYKADPGVTMTGDSAGFGSAFAIGSQSYIVIDGFNIYHTKYKGIYIDSSDHITITHNHVSYAGANTGPDTHQQGIFVRKTTYSTIAGNITDHNSCIGIRLINGSDYNTIRDNVSFANASVIADPVVVVSDAAGIEMTGSSHNTVINNITYGNEDSGINMYVGGDGVGSSYNLVVGNLSYGNGDHGIDNNDSPYNTVVGNTVHGNGTVGINFEGDNGSHHATVANNISAANGLTPPTGSFGGSLRVDAQSTAGTTLDYDLFNLESAAFQIIWNDTSYTSLAAFRAAVSGQETNGSEGDPLFVAPVDPVLRADGVIVPGSEVTGNYHLLAGSPAIDSANADAPNQPLTDIEGNPRVDDPATVDTGAGTTRTYDDRGAYEFQLSTFTLNYTAGANGSLTGDLSQVVSYGGNGTAVTAVPDPGYYFAGWSDSSMDNPRTDTNVKANVDVTANFSLDTCVDVNVAAGWNMVSVPVVADDMSLGTLFPDITLPAYRFNGSYQSIAATDGLQVGIGYWMRFASPQSYQICGAPVDVLDITVSLGWNMIGPSAAAIPVTSISSDPADILVPPVYGYAGGYGQASTLQPGVGYWAKVDQAGTLILDSGAGTAFPAFSDANERASQLPGGFMIPLKLMNGDRSLSIGFGFAGEGSEGFNRGLDSLAPPPAPSGSLDARWNTGGEEYLVDVRENRPGVYVFELDYTSASSQDPLELKWNPAGMAQFGQFTITDAASGELFQMDMAQNDHLRMVPGSVLYHGLRITVTIPHRVFIPNVWMP